jgi:hypothetical protein
MSSSEEDLEGFIVPDRKRKREDDSESESEESLEEENVPELPEDGPELAKVLEEEAKAITGGTLSTTVVNGRTLRDRTKITSPKDQYWERFGTKTMAKLSIVEEKREMLDDIKAWKKEFQNDPECPEIVWPTLTIKDSLEKIKEAHQYVIDTLDLDLRDDDDMTDEIDDEDIEDSEEELDDEDDDDEEEDDDEDDDEEDDDDDETDSDV